METCCTHEFWSMGNIFRQAGSLSLRESDMRILFLSNDFPSRWLPAKGAANFELARALGRQNDVQVVAPIPWIDELRMKRHAASSGWRSRAATRDGITIHFPTCYSTPGIGRAWSDRFLWRSLRPTLNQLLRSFRPEAVMGDGTHPDGAVAVK